MRESHAKCVRLGRSLGCASGINTSITYYINYTKRHFVTHTSAIIVLLYADFLDSDVLCFRRSGTRANFL